MWRGRGPGRGRGAYLFENTRQYDMESDVDEQPIEPEDILKAPTYPGIKVYIVDDDPSYFVGRTFMGTKQGYIDFVGKIIYIDAIGTRSRRLVVAGGAMDASIFGGKKS